jgi:hypothetical protein
MILAINNNQTGGGYNEKEEDKPERFAVNPTRPVEHFLLKHQILAPLAGIRDSSFV